jgi:hypothetical protein
MSDLQKSVVTEVVPKSSKKKSSTPAPVVEEAPVVEVVVEEAPAEEVVEEVAAEVTEAE